MEGRELLTNKRNLGGTLPTHQLLGLLIPLSLVRLQPYPQLFLRLLEITFLGQDPGSLQVSLVKVWFQLQELCEIRQGELMTALREVGGRSEVV